MGKHTRKRNASLKRERRRDRRNTKQDLAFEANQRLGRRDENPDLIDTVVFPAVTD